MLQRVRLSCGSGLEQTGQWQPIIGTPAEVPDPNTVIRKMESFFININYAASIFEASWEVMPIIKSVNRWRRHLGCASGDRMRGARPVLQHVLLKVAGVNGPGKMDLTELLE
jgi:hypothetical protein